MDKTYTLNEEFKVALIAYLSEKPLKHTRPLVDILENKSIFSLEELNHIVNYMANTQIYIEVFKFIHAMQEEVAQQDKQQMEK
jgi:hypothetical protein